MVRRGWLLAAKSRRSQDPGPLARLDCPNERPTSLKAPDSCALGLLSDSQSADQILVAAKVGPLQIIQESPPLTDHFEQTTTGMVILLVSLQVFGQIADPLAQEGNLDFRRAGV